jgi:uracil-DNA glycosylase family 4
LSELEEISAQISACEDCQLSRTRTYTVPGEGSETADIMFIGEAPGFREDQQGRPFIGPAGQLLEQLLGQIGMQRKDVYITNMVKCRPTDNRDPFPGEIQACSKYLDRQIEIVQPKVIVTLGRHSLARFFPKETISKARGRARNVGDITVFPVYHPAAALRQQSLKGILEKDFERLPELLHKPPAPESQEQDEQQLSMF